MRKKFWCHGEISRVARYAQISPKYLSDILARRKGVSLAMAVKLDCASARVLCIRIDWCTWINNQTSKHPAFKRRA